MKQTPLLVLTEWPQVGGESLQSAWTEFPVVSETFAIEQASFFVLSSFSSWGCPRPVSVPKGSTTVSTWMRADWKLDPRVAAGKCVVQVLPGTNEEAGVCSCSLCTPPRWKVGVLLCPSKLLLFCSRPMGLMNASSIKYQSQVIWVLSLGQHLQKLGFQPCVQASSRKV